MNTVQSIEKAVKLLELFNTTRTELSLTELTALAGAPKPTIHRIANTLEKVGFLRKDKKTRKYSLGIKILELSQLVNEPFEIRNIALPYMQKLRDETNESVHLLVEENNMGVYIEKVEGNHELRLWTRLGASRPMYAGASRKIVMAYYDDEKFDDYIEKIGLVKFADKSITDPQALKDNLRVLREQGYCVCEGELWKDTTGISAPIFNREGSVIASLSIVLPTSRTLDKTTELVTRVVYYAGLISEEASLYKL